MGNRTRKGDIRAYWLGLTVCMGGFLFGYDSGIVGGVLTLASFRNDFRYSATQSTSTSSLCVGLQQAGAFLSCFMISPVTEKIGRRWGLILCSVVFCSGVIVQTINTHSLAAFYVGRIIAGFGLGGASVIVPMFSAEMAPKEIRGRMGSCFQWMYTWGIFASYWVDYAVAHGVPSNSSQWQIPVGLQLVPGALLGLGMLTLKESVRWLVKTGQHDRAWESLKWIRADDSEETKAEFLEIQNGVRDEMLASQGFKKRELLEPANRYRLMLGFGVFLAQQCTGSTALAYFGPQFFKQLVGSGTDNLLVTAIFGVVKVVACGTFLIFFSEMLGRRKIFMVGAAGMACCMTIVGVLNKTLPPPITGSASPSGIAMVAMIFLDIVIYNFSWGPLPWPYVSEIYPSRIREIGVSTGVSTQWLFNGIFSFATPYMIKSLGWGTFIFFAACDVAMCFFAAFVMKETQGQSIEGMEQIFHSKAAMGVKDADGWQGVENTVPPQSTPSKATDNVDFIHVEGRS